MLVSITAHIFVSFDYWSMSSTLSTLNWILAACAIIIPLRSIFLYVIAQGFTEIVGVDFEKTSKAPKLWKLREIGKLISYDSGHALRFCKAKGRNNAPTKPVQNFSLSEIVLNASRALREQISSLLPFYDLCTKNKLWHAIRIELCRLSW